MIKLVNGVEMPLTPEEEAEFIERENRWNAEAPLRAANEIREKRDGLLEDEVDAIAGNALRWAALTAAQQQEWATYRQALLDVPQQVEFPDNVVWPTKP